MTTPINDQPGKFTGPGEVRLVRLLPGPIERVWEFLTTPEKRARWFCGGLVEPRAGGKIEFKFRHKDLAPEEQPPEQFKQAHDPGVSFTNQVLRWEPPRLLSHTFDDESEVTFELTPQGDQVLLVLTHRSRGGDVPFLSGYASGWHTHLAHLVSQMAGTPRPPFWPMHARLKEFYARQATAATAG